MHEVEVQQIQSSVLLVGAGQLGSRYLQGLKSTMVLTDGTLNIVVVDPSPDALVSAERRWQEVDSTGAHPKPVFCTSIREAVEQGPTIWDLAILSTTAKHRLEAVTDIVAATTIRHWVLEKVLAQSSPDVRALKDQVGTVSAGFVNTSLRMMPGYAALRKMVVPPLHVAILGGRWGLASNAIHFIDMVVWMTRAQLLDVVAVSETGGWYQSKRPGYFDMTGGIDAVFTDGSRLSMAARANEEPLIISITDSAGSCWTIDQAAGVARSCSGETLHVKLELQSTMTPRLVTGILTAGSCDLTGLHESARMHELLLDALLHDWNAAAGSPDSRVPIT